MGRAAAVGFAVAAFAAVGQTAAAGECSVPFFRCVDQTRFLRRETIDGIDEHYESGKNG